MGARSPVCLNLGWMGLVDEQVVWKIQFWPVSHLSNYCLQVNSSCLGDLTPRRGLVYDAKRFVIYYGLSEGGL
jgi:hypothetical protein